MKIIELESFSKLPDDKYLWNSVNCTPEEAAKEVESRTGLPVKILYKIKGKLQYFIPFDSEAYNEKRKNE